MQDKDQTAAETSDSPAPEQRPLPVSGSVISSAPVQAGQGAAATGTAKIEPADSSLIGQGGLPAAQVRPAKDAKAATEADKPAVKPAEPAPEVDKTIATVPPRMAEAPRQTTVIKRTGFVPTFLGGVVAAGLGAGAMYYAIPNLPEAWRPAAAPIEQVDAQAITDQAVSAAQEAATQAAAQAASQVAAQAARAALADLPAPAAAEADPALAQQVQAQADEIAALKSTLEAAANAPAGEAVPALQLAALEQSLNDMQTRLQDQAQQLTELAARPALDPQAAERLAALAGAAEATQAQIAAAAQEAESRIAEAETEAARLQAETAAAANAARAQAAVARLHGALAEGGDRAAPLADLQAAGVEAPEALTAADIPSLTEVQAGFDQAARDALAAALRDNPGGQGATGIIGNFLKAQTGARSVTPREGDDPDAVLSRAGAAVKAGDIAAAIAGIETLPDSAKATMSGWLDGARRYAQAQAALSGLSAPAN
ncbi:MAG: hypothetical protein Q4G24_07030 [Paracoccus sp. (in: a-proteobacteria)]|uniref:hypothetical protein n=1 Tax=Paracoccus sp. TaxID=267 RepID=UPI0026DFC8A6|nr:hypothetical protein [Paracoccus sp. (in: a-proteobacteria)]MDO5621206.1 hypothetical protein [Paracoccus sp. (in: a-proteobacteria)]